MNERRQSLPAARLTVPLPAPAVRSLADLVATGLDLVRALQVLPKRSLSPLLRREIETSLKELRSGQPLDIVLSRLGLDITAVAIRGARPQSGELVEALRADADARETSDEALGKIRSRVQLFVIILGALTVLVVYVSFVFVPNIIRELSTNVPEGWELPEALVRFERFRDLWLTLGGCLLLTFIAVVLIYAGWLGKQGWQPFVQDLRLHLPFLRSHAIHASSARLLEALVHEQRIGVPANETLRRVRLREPVPGLQEALELAAERLESGDPWATCLRGTPLDSPTLADLAALAGRGADPTQGWRWAARQHREKSVKQLRWAAISTAILVLGPSLLFMGFLLHTAAVTVTIAQVEGVSQQLEMLTQEVESMIDTQTDSEP